MTDLPALVLRVETGPGVGVGHLARGVNLAATWCRRGGRATVVTDDLAAVWGGRAAVAGIEVADVASWTEVVDGVDVVLVDGYGLGGATPRALAGDRYLVVVDDFAIARAEQADLVVDQNLGSDAARYPAVPSLIGPRYALLPGARREAAVHEPAERARPVARLVVSLGGSVPLERRQLAERVIGASGTAAEVVFLDGSQDLGMVLPGADLALAAAGSTCWELCRFGVPSVVVTVADNQVLLARALDGAGVAVDGGRLEDRRLEAVAAELSELLADGERRVAMAEAAVGLVDGWGSDRVVTRLRSAELRLEPVAATDADLLLAWRNDPGTVSASFDRDPVGAEDHQRWLAEVLADPTRSHWLVADRHGALVGLVRFDDVVDGRAEIGVTVAPDRRGEGWAASLVDAGCRQLAAEHGPVEVLARVRPENHRSRRAFRAADFDPVRPDDSPEPEGWHGYSRSCDGR